ncbi:MAG: phosphopentomutase [Bacillota bacterium]|nr:phosphopentomutase [Bacillota bacterium]
MKRTAIIVIDSLGIGALPDAEEYGDPGADTLGSIVKHCPKLDIPHLRKLGLGNIDGVKCLEPEKDPSGAFARMAERSRGKDTITGHWEIAGLYTTVPFKTFPRFPDSFMEAFEKAIGRGTLGNYAASGTEIIKELGPEHKATGKPIVYTSADSVFQVAADNAVIPLEELYRICQTAREMLVGELQVGRVIARPYVVEDGVYTRTADRRDYAVSPPADTLLDLVKATGQPVYAVGKITDIFNGKGVTRAEHTKSNLQGIELTIAALKEETGGLIFTNLVDFDAKYGHRRNPEGYGACLEELDSRIPELLAAAGPEDLLLFCADHGNDPCYKGWDHTREYTPMLAAGKPLRRGANLGTRSSFADIAATVAEYLGTGAPATGESFLQEILKS